jgi:tetratricopeptide (TPR) repeat protein
MPETRTRQSIARSVFTPLILFFCFCVTSPALAQQDACRGPISAAETRGILVSSASIAKEKNTDVIVFCDEITLDVQADGRAKEVTRLVYRIDTPGGVESWASIASRYSPWYQAKPVVRARVIAPDGVAHELDPKTLIDVTLKDNSENVYSDDHEVRGPLPAVAVGSIIEEQISVEDTAPFFEGQWSSRIFLGFSAPVLHSVAIVTTPTNLPLKYAPRLLPDLKIQKSDANGRTTVVFDQARIDPQEREPFLPPDVPRWPHIAMTTASSWHDLAVRYDNHTAPQVRPEEVRALVSNISGSDDEKIAAILAKVHANARYTGVEFGEASIIPQPPSETLKRKYGDCKDKATLLVSMLRAVGIPAQLALLNAGGGYDVDPEMPSMNLFDHAIAYLPSKNTFIDVTAEYSRYGDLPTDDQGRLALVISSDTHELKRTPEFPSSANRQVETREVFLAEYGAARIVETTQSFGNRDAFFRGSYDGSETKQQRKELDDYVKSTYLAEGLTRFEHGEASDLNKPFTLRIEAAKAKRGNTSLEDAAVVIRAYDLVTQMIPADLRDEDRDAKRQADDLRKKPRTADWYLDRLWQTEWQYRMVPPPGFSVRGLPEKVTVNLGPAVLTEEYKLGTDGVVLGTIRLDLTKRRYTNAEVDALRVAFKEYGRRSVTVVNFDLTGHKYIEQGKVKEGLQEIRKLAAMHPKEGLHRAQLARAFLAAGLGDMARVEAREATKLDPKSAESFNTLGYVLIHDEAGREFQSGWDPAGAEAANRKAMELDPKNANSPLNLAVLLEHDAEGDRYSAGAKLDQAIRVYNDMKKIEDVNLDSVNDRLVYTLAYAGKFRELRDMLVSLPRKPLYEGMRVMATASLDGTPAAMKQAQDITGGEKAKTDALAFAGNLSMRSRLYKQASELMAAAAPGQQNAAALANLAQVLQRTKRFEDMDGDPQSPVGYLLSMIPLSIRGSDAARFEDEFSHAWHKLPKPYRDAYFRAHRGLKVNADLPRDVILDLGLSVSRMNVSGDDATGYRVEMQAAGTKADSTYIVKENGKLKWLAESKELAPLGQEVMDRIARNDLKGAKVLLDWAREDMKLAGGEDPYGGPAFPRVWNKRQDADASTMRVAAAMLMAPARGALAPYLADIAASCDRTEEKDKAKLREVQLQVYMNVRDWPHVEQVARTILASVESPAILQSLDSALMEQDKWDAIPAVIEQHRGKLPDESFADRERARVFMRQDQPEKSMAAMKKVIDAGKAETADLNSYGWSAVMLGEVTPDMLETVQTGIQTKNQTYGPIHTLACMYAVAGRAKQAQEMLGLALKLDPTVGEPNSVIWYGYARLAESYGETEAAARLYRKVHNDDQETPNPATTYALAQRRLMTLASKGIIAAGQ